jgi:hypothetical protein
MRTLSLFPLLSILMPAAAAQQELVVPNAWATADAPGRLWVAGFTTPLRQQLVIGPQHLQTLVGRSITALSVRRDAGIGQAIDGGRTDLVVRIATATRPTEDADDVLDRNLGADAVTVFAGTVTLPASGPLAGSSVPWDPTHAVRIAFTTPFSYRGGPLCIDLTGSPVAQATSRHWGADAVIGSERGSYRAFGTSCGPYPGGSAPTGERQVSSIDPRTLLLGGTARFIARGQPGRAASMLIGFAALPQPVGLAAVGAPSCFVYVAGIAALSTTFGAELSPLHAELGGFAGASLRIPANPGLLGARFFTQWVDFGPPLATTNALECTIGQLAPRLALTTVTALRVGSTYAPTGAVMVDAGLVVRFEAR